MPRPVITDAFIVSEPLAKILYDIRAGLSSGIFLNIVSISPISPLERYLYTFAKLFLSDIVSKK